MDKAKRKKLFIGAGVIAVIIIGGFALTSLDSPPKPTVKPAMTAKQAMAKARAKFEATKHHAPTAPVSVAPSAKPPHKPVAAPSAIKTVQVPKAAHHTRVVGAAPVAPPTHASVPTVPVVPVRPSTPASAPTRVPPKPVVHPRAPSSSVAQPAAPHTTAPVAHPQSAADAGKQAAVEAKQVADNQAGYYAALDRVHRQIQFLKLQAQVSKLVRSINGHSASAPKPTSPVSLMPPPMRAGGDSAQVGSAAASFSVPVFPAKAATGSALVSVAMANGQYRAVILTHGARLTVHQGSHVGGWTVRSISPNGVRLVKGRHHKMLRVGG